MAPPRRGASSPPDQRRRAPGPPGVSPQLLTRVCRIFARCSPTGFCVSEAIHGGPPASASRPGAGSGRTACLYRVIGKKNPGQAATVRTGALPSGSGIVKQVLRLSSARAWRPDRVGEMTGLGDGHRSDSKYSRAAQWVLEGTRGVRKLMGPRMAFEFAAKDWPIDGS
jgi:hypothetical protein